MTEIVVWGAVPVGIHVDTESGEVTRVVVIDEDLAYPKDIHSPLTGELAVSTNGYLPVWDREAPEPEFAAQCAEARKALEIAEGEAKEPWPAWEFGY